MDMNKNIEIDLTSGSRSYNRLDMQASQSLHMAIEFYDQFNFDIIGDYYDDIKVLNLDEQPFVVSYYQMKTSTDGQAITIDSAIKKDWLAKMYRHLDRPEGWTVKELGLITNQPLYVTFKINDKKGKAITRKEKYEAPHTSFTKFDQSVQNRIRADIAGKCGISINDVDLSKFAHIHTTLTIRKHRELAENELSNFLYDKYPNIKVDTVKGIYKTVIDILTKRQEDESLPDDAELDEVRKQKGFSKDEFDRIIDKSILLSVPSFEDVCKYIQASNHSIGTEAISLPYVTILTDSNKHGDCTFSMIFNETIKAIKNNPVKSAGNIWSYAQAIEGIVLNKVGPILASICKNSYVAVLVVCILINESRKSR